MVAPRRTRPVFRKNSVRKYAASRSRMPKSDRSPLAKSPNATAYTGNSITRSCLFQLGTVLLSHQVAQVRRTTSRKDADHQIHGAEVPWRGAATASCEDNTRSLIIGSPLYLSSRSRNILENPRQHQGNKREARDYRHPILREDPVDLACLFLFQSHGSSFPVLTRCSLRARGPSPPGLEALLGRKAGRRPVPRSPGLPGSYVPRLYSPRACPLRRAFAHADLHAELRFSTPIDVRIRRLRLRRELRQILDRLADPGHANPFHEAVELFPIQPFCPVQVQQPPHQHGRVLRGDLDRGPSIPCPVKIEGRAQKHLVGRHLISMKLLGASGEADAGDVMVAAGVGAARDLNPDPRLVSQVSVAIPEDLTDGQRQSAGRGNPQLAGVGPGAGGDIGQPIRRGVRQPSP